MTPFKYWKATIRSPCSFLSSGWPAPTLSAFPHRRDAPAPRSFLWPSSGPAPTGPCLSCAEGSRAGRRTPGGVSPEQSRRAESPPSTCWPRFFWRSPGYGWPCWLPAHIGGSCPAFHAPVAPSPSWQGCSQSLHLHSVLTLGAAPTQVQDPALGLVEPHKVHTGPLLQLVQVPPNGILFLRCVDHTPHLGVICKLAEGALDTTMSLTKILHSTGPNIDPWGIPLVTDLHLGIEPLTTTCWTQPSNQFLIHQSVHTSNPCILYFTLTEQLSQMKQKSRNEILEL